jgi:hypothetical protein
MPLNEDKLQQFMNTALQEATATYHAALVVLGDKLGLYKALADWVTPLGRSHMSNRPCNQMAR